MRHMQVLCSSRQRQGDPLGARTGFDNPGDHRARIARVVVARSPQRGARIVDTVADPVVGIDIVGVVAAVVATGRSHSYRLLHILYLVLLPFIRGYELFATA